MRKLINSAGWVLLLIASSALPLQAQSTATVLVGPEDQSIEINQETKVNIAIIGADQVYGFQMDLRYNPQTLEFTGWQEGEFIKRETANNPFWVNPETNEPGLIKGVAVTRIGPDQPVSGAGTLLSFNFKGLANGVSPVGIENLIFSDQFGNRLPVSTVDEQIGVGSGTISNQTPEKYADQATVSPTKAPDKTRFIKLTGIKNLINWVLNLFSKKTGRQRPPL